MRRSSGAGFKIALAWRMPTGDWLPQWGFLRHHNGGTLKIHFDIYFPTPVRDFLAGIASVHSGISHPTARAQPFEIDISTVDALRAGQPDRCPDLLLTRTLNTSSFGGPASTSLGFALARARIGSIRTNFWWKKIATSV